MFTNIINLIYFIKIVICNYNLTKATARCHNSQPALSNYIKTIEFEVDITLFFRKKGRLVGLASIGERFYENAKLVISSHEQLTAF
ncbi:MAG: LysR family transcriptional regulator [Streptococcus parauberis]